MRKGKFKSFGKEVGIKLLVSMIGVMVVTFVAVHALIYRLISEDYGRLLDMSIEGIRWDIGLFKKEIEQDVSSFLKAGVKPLKVEYIVREDRVVFNSGKVDERKILEISSKPVGFYKDRVFWNLVVDDVIAGVRIDQVFLRRLSRNVKGNGFVIVKAGGKYIAPYFVDLVLIEKALKDRFGRFSFKLNDQSYVADSLNITGITIYTVFSTMLFDEIFRDIMFALLFAFAASIGVIGFISYRIAAYLSKNLRMILDGFEKLREGSFEFLEIRSEDELGMMMAEFNVTVAVLKDAMEKLKMAKEIAEEANRTKNMFLASVSHEIRTPLNSILGFAELLLREEKDPKKREYLSTIYKSGEHLLNVINEILDLSKIEAGRMGLSFDRYSPVKLVEDVVKMYQPIAVKKGINVTMKVEDGVPKEAIGDPFRIKQILINLVSNAIKFTEEGYVVIGLRKEGKDLIFTVADTGIGIPKEKLEEIFEPFTQADSSISRKYGGTGLGLTISKKLANLMNGDLWIESEVGKGTKVFLRIPVKVVEEQRIEAKVSTEPDLIFMSVHDEDLKETVVKFFEDVGFEIEEFGKVEEVISKVKELMPRLVVLEVERTGEVKGILREVQTVAFLPEGSREIKLKNVLFLPRDLGKEELISKLSEFLKVSLKEKIRIALVEDNKVNRNLMMKMLEKFLKDCEVEQFENGEEIVKVYEKGETFDIVLMDAQMPVMDGFTASKKMRALGYGGIIMMVSASVGREDVERAMEAGCDDFVPKPVKSALLKKKFWKYFPKAVKTDEAPSSEGRAGTDRVIRMAVERMKGEMNMDDEIALGMMRDYIKFLKRKLEMLRRAVENRDQKAARRVGHDLSGSGEMYSLPEITKLGDAIRRFAKEDDFASLERLLERFEKLLERFEKGLEGIQS